MDVGGSLTGEHGIGTDKACRMPLMFSEADLEVDAAPPPRLRPRRGSAIRARSFRRRDSAARCPAPTVPTRSSWPVLPNVSEAATVEEAAELLADDARHVARPCPSSARAVTSCSRRARLDRVLEHEAGRPDGDRRGRHPAVGAERRDSPRAGQMLALDPPGDPTIGACLAGNLTGPRRHRYGGPRDLVLGVTVVLADGTVASAGGKVVKNVAGYDLGKLFCGSQGRLGLVARVSLRLHPAPGVGADARRAGRRISTTRTGAPNSSTSRHSSRARSISYSSEGARSSHSCSRGRSAPSSAQLAAARAWSAARRRRARSGTSRPGAAGARVRPAVVSATRARPDTDRRARGSRSSGGRDARTSPHPVPAQGEAGAVALAERVRAAFDPAGVLA